ncbi:MAG: SemiSWEET transporter [Alphaproteobacteria bacterium]|nr:SemiSWEET transporter [Alphaproteobacteria bacterium]
MMSFLGEFFGYVAGICTAVVFLPQAIKTIRSQDVQSLSFLSYLIYCIGMVSWILYGIYLHSVQMIIFNSLSLLFTAPILYLIIRNKK